MRILRGLGTGMVFLLIFMFQITTGFAFVVLTGVLDGVMINELGVPALLVGFLLGVDFIAQPLRPYFGSLSDRFSFRGLHRLPFILLGGVALALTYPAIVLVVEQLRDPNYQQTIGQVHNTGGYQANPLWLVLAIVLFAINGLALALMGTIAMSLMVDITKPHTRGLVASISWCFLIFGIVVGSIANTQILPDTEGRSFDYKTLYPVFFFIVPGVIVVLVLLTCLGAFIKEPRINGPLVQGRTHVNFRKAIGVVSRSRPSRWFFLFLFVVMTFMFMRDILAPAFGGNVFRMSVKERSSLQSVINGPLLLAMIVTGLLTLKVAKKLACYVGLGVAVLGMLIQAVAGFTFQASQQAIQAYETAGQQFSQHLINQGAYDTAVASWNSLIAGNKGMFTLGLIVMGLGLGIAVPGLLGLMMDMTDPANAALFIGTWSLGQALGQNLSSILAGGVRDLAYNTFPDNLGVGYGFVFVMQAAGMGLSIWLLTRVNERRFKESLEAVPVSSPEAVQPEAVAVV